jgi:transposase
LARLRREKAELVEQHAKERAVWEKQRAGLEDERDDAPMFVKW